jgi:hypothetical protein
LDYTRNKNILQTQNKPVYLHSSNPKAKAHHIIYCKILRKVIKEAKQQHYITLIAKSSNEIKTTWNIIRKETRKVYTVEQVPKLIVNDEKFKDPTNMVQILQ